MTVPPGSTAPGAPDAILETVIYAADLAQARSFYAGILGLPVLREVPGRFLFLTCGAQMLLIFDPEASRADDPANPLPRHGATGPGHLCFAAAMPAILDFWRARLVAEGIAIEHDHLWPGGGRSFYVRDPAGNSVEFAEPRIWGL